MKCALCKTKECYEGKNCFADGPDLRQPLSDEDRRLSRAAAEVEAEGYLRWTRLEEIIEFAKRLDVRRVGLAFCIGFADEARQVHEILADHFEVHSVCCKAGGVKKDGLGYPHVRPERDEVACHPLAQARLLARENTQMNIILGLCVGHDMLFTRHSQAPVTTLAVKDRVLAHNPLGVLYSGYQRRARFDR